MKTIYVEDECSVEHDNGLLSIAIDNDRVVLGKAQILLLITALVNHYHEMLEGYFTDDDQD